MFDPSPNPRVFAMPPGADFPAALVAGLSDLTRDARPDALARATLFVNTTRMQRRIRALFTAGPPRLLPRVRLLSAIGQEMPMPGVPLPVPPLRRRLELSQLIARLIEAHPGIAPRAAIYDLADSLAALMDEMQGEGVGTQAIRDLDVKDDSGYWQTTQAFLDIVAGFLSAEATRAPDPEARQRMAVERLIADWAARPPEDPVILAGSTGSRGTTLMLMEAVAHLPQGALVLPGFDTDLPQDVWDRLTKDGRAEDHPQYRYARLCQRLGITPKDVPLWHGAVAPCPARNQLISLALRPAPVTNQWLSEGPEIADLATATQDITLVEAPSPRAEALAIATLLREGVEAGKTSALVSPDRVLTRRVTAYLGRWGIEPDDSAGRPLDLSPPGRLLRQVAEVFGEPPTLGQLLALLKHPLVNLGDGRGEHLLAVRDLELWLRRKALPWPGTTAIEAWVAKDGEAHADWAAWLMGFLVDLEAVPAGPLADLVAAHVALADQLVAGPGAGDPAALWTKPEGRKAAEVMGELRAEAVHGGPMTLPDYRTLVNRLVSQAEVREAQTPDPRVMIWGTLEARVQGADLVILGSLNEGTWPEAPAADPWLNRRMRADAGLLLPERRIGLAAHDFQQAVAAPQVVLTRPLRSDATEPVPSRWLNRLTNLLGGLTETGGSEALDAMRARGQRVLGLAETLDTPTDIEQVPPAPRPSPRPPVVARPTRLSVTDLEKLVRDPYAIYARHILKLRPLMPLNPRPDALLRGNLVHALAEVAVKSGFDTDAVARAAEQVFADVPWPMIARIWRGQFAKVTPAFLAKEVVWGDSAHTIATECVGEMRLSEPEFVIHGRADRIDHTQDASLAILDYKTGTLPSKPDMDKHSIQLLIEALIAEDGGFEGVPATPVGSVVYIGLGSSFAHQDHTLPEDHFAMNRARLSGLLSAYLTQTKGFSSRRAMEKVRFEGDYDHLARFGEWTDSTPVTPEDVG